MILVIKKKSILIILSILLIVAITIGTTLSFVHTFSDNQTAQFIVVLDAGHGGRDNGVIGVESGIAEKVLNLAVTMLVKEQLEKAKIKVVLTRKDNDGLYGDAKSNFKLTDMKRRKEIINEATPDVVVSIHMNKYPTDSARRGAQVFFEQMSPSSKELARCLQGSLNTLNTEILAREFSPLKGEYYILKCSKFTSAIVECGFMSNVEDDRLLCTVEHQQKVAYQIYSGIMAYLSLNTSYNNMENLSL